MASINHTVFSEEICHWGPSLPLSSSCSLVLPRPTNPYSIPHPIPTYLPHPQTSHTQHCAFRPNLRPPPLPTMRRSRAGASPLVVTVPAAVDSPGFPPLPRVALAPQPLLMFANLKAVVGQFEAKRPDFFFKRCVHVWFCERATPHKTAELFFFKVQQKVFACACV